MAKEEAEHKGLQRTWLLLAVSGSPLALSVLTSHQPKHVSWLSLQSSSSEVMAGSTKSHCKRHGYWEGRRNEAINSIYHSSTTCLLVSSGDISTPVLSPKTSYRWICSLLPNYLSISPGADTVCKKYSTCSLGDQYFHLTFLTEWRQQLPDYKIKVNQFGARKLTKKKKKKGMLNLTFS